MSNQTGLAAPGMPATGLVPPKIVAVGTQGISPERLAGVDFKPIETLGDIEASARRDARLYRGTMSDAELIQAVWLRNLQLGKARVTGIVKQVLVSPIREEVEPSGPNYEGVSPEVKAVLEQLASGVAVTDVAGSDEDIEAALEWQQQNGV
jgi:hypothetical protein